MEIHVKNQTAGVINYVEGGQVVYDGLHGSVSRVVVTELRDGTYYSVLVLQAPGGVLEVDARPSDAIALALRTGAPLFVREALFEATRSEPAPPLGSDEHST